MGPTSHWRHTFCQLAQQLLDLADNFLQGCFKGLCVVPDAQVR